MFGTHLSRLGSVHRLGLVHKAIGILRKYGTNAHVYLPGVGTISGITAGNYLDSAGTTAASVDNPVGLSLDALQAMTLGAELAPALSAGNGWITETGWSLGANQTTATSAGAGTSTYKAIGSTNGNTYQVTFTLSGYVSGSCYATLFNGVNGPAISANGTYTCTLTRNYVTDLAGVAAATPNFSGTISGLSIKQIPGVHATQGTTANKPILRRGLLNLATWSMDVSNAAWTANVAGSASAIARTPSYTTSPDGYPATRIQISLNSGTATGDISYLYQSVIPSTTICTGGIYIKSNTTDCSMYMRIGNSEYTIAVTSAWTLIPNVCPAGNTSSQFAFGLRGGQSSPCSNSIDVSIASAGLFQGTYTAQQIIDAGGIPLTTSAAASNPSAGKYWWQFDGSNDSLSLSAPLFQMSDDHAVIAGFNAAVINKYIFSQNNTAATTLVASLRIDAAGAPNALWQDDSATLVNVASSTSCIGLNTVATGVKIGNAKRLRVNGVQQGATNNTVLGATTLNTASIGSYTTAGNFQGSIYPVIAIKGTVSDADLLTLERFVGQLSGVSI